MGSVIVSVHGIPPAPMFMQLSKEAIFADPMGYIEVVAENIYAAYYRWAFFDGTDEIPAAHRSPFAVAFPPNLMLVGLIVSLAIMLLSLSQTIAVLGLVALALNFIGVGFASGATVFIPRYAVPLDPIVLIAISCGVGLAFEGALRRIKTARYPCKT